MRGIVHQIRAGRSPKRLSDLVQRKRRNRVLRGFVHQIRAGRSPKSLLELVQGKRRNRVLRGIVHQVCAGRSPSRKALRRPFAEKAPELGVKETEEQGFAGNRAPSPRRPDAEKATGIGARETEEQGFARNRAPSPRRPSAFGPKDMVPVDERARFCGE